ncbi:MAG: hypothetical protein GY782_04385 [Gammaproteobacteria bacterium]|nr:hypothetical protein [Gammaproteobacteria bacterium]
MTASCLYVSTMLGCTLHSVVSSTTSTHDEGPAVVLCLLAAVYAWQKDNHYDEHSGVLTSNSSVGLLAAVVLVVMSEVMLFLCMLWATVLVLTAHSAYGLCIVHGTA